MGSDPGDNKKINGVFGSLSSNDAWRLNGGGSTYTSPIFLMMNDWNDVTKMFQRNAIV